MRGVRFAPSPTGVFHVGNLRTAWVSWRLARLLGEPWIVRYEDIDAPRSAPGAREAQRAHMATLGLEADDEHAQSARVARHWELFASAAAEGAVYPCFCSRKAVREALEGAASAPHGVVASYTGHCRDLTEFPSTDLPTVAWRFRMPGGGGDDFIIARTLPPTERGSAAFEALRPSFVPAYHWACAIDDADGGYRLLVRAHDLAPVLPLQRAICRYVLGPDAPLPAVYHTALVTRDDGGRLEKRTKGVSLVELQTDGWTANGLIQDFDASLKTWPSAKDIVPDAVLGEAVKTIPLSALLPGPPR